MTAVLSSWHHLNRFLLVCAISWGTQSNSVIAVLLNINYCTAVMFCVCAGQRVHGIQPREGEMSHAAAAACLNAWLNREMPVSLQTVNCVCSKQMFWKRVYGAMPGEVVLQLSKSHGAQWGLIPCKGDLRAAISAIFRVYIWAAVQCLPMPTL